MGLAVTLSRAQEGLDAPLVTVEVYVSGGLPRTAIVGLPETAVREARDRVRVAIQSLGFQYPYTRVTVNLAPAELPKTGGRFDLAIALGVLGATGQVRSDQLAACEFLGELALSGELRPVHGILPALLRARDKGTTVVIPRANMTEAALVRGADIRLADSLTDVCAWLNGATLDVAQSVTQDAATVPPACDLAQVNGQMQARRALEIAAAGGHHMVLIGPPGTGKTMLAERLPGILPSLTDDEALASCAVRSVAGEMIDPQNWHQRPFRRPHHTASAAALVGGGSYPRPGEISLAHHGVLFLDELPEFNRQVLEVLREPLESGHIVVSRALQKVTYPACFQLIAAMNPCPCGYAGDPDNHCRCTPDQVDRYHTRVSGPLWDRIDMHVNVPRVPIAELIHHQQNESSTVVRQRVEAARARAYTRQGMINSALNTGKLEQACALSAVDKGWLETALERLKLSARAYHRVLRMARTIADLDLAADNVGRMHLAEALQLRRLDKE